MNAHGKAVDTTYLSLETASERGFIHRDYIAHCMRWSHVAKFITERHRYKTARVLDIGCGRELPLPMMLYSMKLTPEQYVGVDYGKINEDAYNALTKTGKFPTVIYEEEDFATVDLEGYHPTLITCFEMLEHIEPKHMLAVITRALQEIDPAGTAFFSTPCWNTIDCAANHVNEIKYEVLGAIFEKIGWTIENVWGTFASIRDYEHLLNPEQLKTFNALRSYYDSNFLSCVFAPMFPAQSRNALWQLKPVKTSNPKFRPLEEVPMPWSSSTQWRELL